MRWMDLSLRGPAFLPGNQGRKVAVASVAFVCHSLAFHASSSSAKYERQKRRQRDGEVGGPFPPLLLAHVTSPLLHHCRSEKLLVVLLVAAGTVCVLTNALIAAILVRQRGRLCLRSVGGSNNLEVNLQRFFSGTKSCLARLWQGSWGRLSSSILSRLVQRI